MNIPAALPSFDALYLIHRITRVTASRTRSTVVGAAELEVHTLAYFANLLEVWAFGDDWGYNFFTTPDSEPFATALSDAIRTLKRGGLIVDQGILLVLSDAGAQFLEAIDETIYASRSEKLERALTAARLLPLPLVVRAIINEPTLKSARPSRPLLDEADLAVVGEYLDSARDLLGDHFSLTAVAELIVNYFLAASEPQEMV